jgi:prevent-host-death family protein
MTEPLNVSLYEAKTHLSELGERAARGEEIVVTKHGRPRFKLVPVAVAARRPAPGAFVNGMSTADRTRIDDIDWFAPDDDIEREFGLRG